MRRFSRSLRYALEGVWHALRTERNLKLFTALYIFSLLISAVLNVSVRDWEMVIFSGALFLAMELVNTALERFADAFHTHARAQNDLHTQAMKVTKDTAAGASLVCALGWIIILVMIYFPRLWILWMGGKLA